LDKQAPYVIIRSQSFDGETIFKQPYVATVTQGDGSYAMITINPRGAFFEPQARLQEVSREGGPIWFAGVRTLNVGIYRGASLPAQVLTLLHEFGHVIDLLPPDGDDLDGSSIQNTNQVLRYCRAEIDTHAKQPAH
jgi:hypothetical protein